MSSCSAMALSVAAALVAVVSPAVQRVRPDPAALAAALAAASRPGAGAAPFRCAPGPCCPTRPSTRPCASRSGASTAAVAAVAVPSRVEEASEAAAAAAQGAQGAQGASRIWLSVSATTRRIASWRRSRRPPETSCTCSGTTLRPPGPRPTTSRPYQAVLFKLRSVLPAAAIPKTILVVEVMVVMTAATTMTTMTTTRLVLRAEASCGGPTRWPLPCWAARRGRRRRRPDPPGRRAYV